jgi:hypothetical protein
MLGVDFVVMLGALFFFFLRSAQDADIEQEAEERAAMEQPHLVQPAAVRETGVGLG